MRHGVIYADPPWNFKNYSEKGTGRNAVAHYQCMDFAALAALQPQRWAAKDCVLFMWATDPLLPKALELIKAWASLIRRSASNGPRRTSGQSSMSYRPTTSSPGLATGRARTSSSAYWQREARRRG